MGVKKRSIAGKPQQQVKEEVPLSDAPASVASRGQERQAAALTATAPAEEKEEERVMTGVGLGLVTLLCVITNSLTGASLMQLGPQYLEPVFGNVLPYVNYRWAVALCLVYGAFLGGIWFKRGPVPSSYQYGMAISRAFNVLAVLTALAPARLSYMFEWSEWLGPEYGPHVIQLGFSYPVYMILGLTAMVVACKLGYTPWSQARSAVTVTGVLTAEALVGLAATRFVSRQRSCEGVLLTATNASIAGVLVGILTNYFLSVGRRKDGAAELPASNANDDEDGEARASKKNGDKFRHVKHFWPLGVCVLAFSSTMYRNAQCTHGVTWKHQLNPQDQLADIHTKNQQTPSTLAPYYRVLSRVESVTGWVEVIDTQHTDQDLRVMRSGHSLVGGIWKKTSESAMPVFYMMDAVKYTRQPNATGQERALQIGLGAGITCRSLYKQNVQVDIVEIDPAVYQAAVEYFEVPKEITGVYIQDGRQFIEEALSSTYDYVIHDVFTGGSVPPSLFSKEAIGHIRRILKPHGVLVLNYVGGFDREMKGAFGHVVKTLRSVFPHLRCFSEQDPGDLAPQPVTNIVFFASDSQVKFRFPRYITNPSADDNTIRTYVLENMLDHEIDLGEMEGNDKAEGLVITDAYNPLFEFQVSSAIVHWRTMREMFPSTFWHNY